MEDIADPSEGFAGTFEASFARFQVCVERACAENSDWAARIATAIRAGFEFAAADPAAADILTNRALAAGGDGVARYNRLLAYVAEGLAPGREARPDGAELPQLTERAIAGGLAGLVAERLGRRRADELPALASEAIQFALTPYLGMDRARRVAGTI